MALSRGHDVEDLAEVDTASMSELLDSIRTVVEAERTRFGVPGCAVTVVKDGQVLLAEGFGTRNVDEDLPVTSATLFPIGSSTKSFTSAVVASLVDEGVLDLDCPVREYLPGFAMHDPAASAGLTLRDCLSHRSGLPRHDVLWYAGEGILSRDDIIAALPHLPSNKPFRQTWQYNNLLFITAGHLAGRVSGGSFEDVVRTRILEPLGMARTGFEVLDVQADPDHAKPYVTPPGEDVTKQLPFASLDLAGPAGNINSCADDMASWLLTLLGQGVGGAAPLLSASVLSEMTAPTMVMPSAPEGGHVRPVGYGLGLLVEEFRGQRVVHHGGNIDGFASQVLFVPSAGIGICVLTNLHGTALRDALPYLLLDLLQGAEPTPYGETLHARMTASLQDLAQVRAARAASVKPLGAVRPLEDYAGSYEHPGYGALVIDAADGELTGVYLALPRAVLEHRHLEVFDLVLTLAGTEQRVPLQFTHDLDGEVDALLLRLEPSVPPMRFARP